MQTFEEAEDLFRELRLNSDPVIRHGENAPAISFVGRNMDTRNLPTAILNRVADQVLKNLRQTALMNRNDG